MVNAQILFGKQATLNITEFKKRSHQYYKHYIQCSEAALAAAYPVVDANDPIIMEKLVEREKFLFIITEINCPKVYQISHEMFAFAMAARGNSTLIAHSTDQPRPFHMPFLGIYITGFGELQLGSSLLVRAMQRLSDELCGMHNGDQPVVSTLCNSQYPNGLLPEENKLCKCASDEEQIISWFATNFMVRNREHHIKVINYLWDIIQSPIFDMDRIKEMLLVKEEQVENSNQDLWTPMPFHRGAILNLKNRHSVWDKENYKSTMTKITTPWKLYSRLSINSLAKTICDMISPDRKERVLNEANPFNSNPFGCPRTISDKGAIPMPKMLSCVDGRIQSTFADSWETLPLWQDFVMENGLLYGFPDTGCMIHELSNMRPTKELITLSGITVMICTLIEGIYFRSTTLAPTSSYAEIPSQWI